MRALHRSAADIQRRTDDLIDSESLSPDCGADNVDHRIDRADFVKVHLLN